MPGSHPDMSGVHFFAMLSLLTFGVFDKVPWPRSLNLPGYDLRMLSWQPNGPKRNQERRIKEHHENWVGTVCLNTPPAMRKHTKPCRIGEITLFGYASRLRVSMEHD